MYVDNWTKHLGGRLESKAGLSLGSGICFTLISPLLTMSYLSGDHSNVLNQYSTLMTYQHISLSSDGTTHTNVERASVIIPISCTTIWGTEWFDLLQVLVRGSMRTWWILPFYHVATHKSGLILKTVSEIILSFSNIQPKAFICNLPEPLKLLFISTVTISEASCNIATQPCSCLRMKQQGHRNPLRKGLLSLENWQKRGQTNTGTLKVWPLASSVTLGQSFKFHEPEFPYPKNGSPLELWSW